MILNVWLPEKSVFLFLLRQFKSLEEQFTNFFHIYFVIHISVRQDSGCALRCSNVTSFCVFPGEVTSFTQSAHHVPAAHACDVIACPTCSMRL